MDGFNLWLAALDDYARSLQDYVRVIDDAALRSRPRMRDTYRAAIDEASAILSVIRETIVDIVDPDVVGDVLAEKTFGVFDSLERGRAELDRGAESALGSDLLEVVAIDMSRTYIDSLRGLARGLNKSRESAAGVAQSASEQISGQIRSRVVESAAAASVGAVYRQGRSLVSANLYSAILSEYARRLSAAEIGELVDAAAEETLGGEPDTRERVVADLEERRKYHPVQSMGLTFGLSVATFEDGPEPGLNDVLIDSTLPGAEVVDFDIWPLIDPVRAHQFGPLSTEQTGLNFQVVKRLDAIRTRPARHGSASADVPRIEAPLNRTSRVVQTVDGGASFRRLGSDSAPGAEAPDFRFVAAGPKRRVGLYSEIVTREVRGPSEPGVADSRRQLCCLQSPGSKWVAEESELVERFGREREGLEDVIAQVPIDQLVRVVVAHFETVYDASPPKTKTDLLNLVAFRGAKYVPQAVSEVFSKTFLQKTLDRRAARPLGGRASVSTENVRIELILSLSSQIDRVASSLERRIRASAWSLVVPRVARRKDYIAAVRDVVRDAILGRAGVQYKATALMPQATLKIHYLSIH